MTYLPYKFGKAVGYALLIWIIGFVWGTIVFMVPSLKNLPSVAYISKYPAISIPLLVVYAILLFYISRAYLEETEMKSAEGIRFGVTIFLVSIVLDALVYVVVFGTGNYFVYLSIWLSYAIFIIIPWETGRLLQVQYE